MNTGDEWEEFTGPAPEPWVPARLQPAEAQADADTATRATGGPVADAPPGAASPAHADDAALPPQDEGGDSAAVASSDAQPEASPLSRLEDQLTGLRADLLEVQAELRRVATVAEHESRLVDRLHTENQRLQRSELDRLRDPFIRDLIGLGDTSVRNARAWEARGGDGASAVAEALRGVADDVRLILERQGVEPYEPATGSEFKGRDQRAVETRHTSDEHLAGTVAHVQKPGYRIGGRLLRAADVVVWRLETGQPHTGRAADTAGQPSEVPDTRAEQPALGSRGGEELEIEG